jgi:hypothetical protein
LCAAHTLLGLARCWKAVFRWNMLGMYGVLEILLADASAGRGIRRRSLL